MNHFNKFWVLVLLIFFLCTKGIAATKKQFDAIAVAHPPFTLKETTEHGVSWELCKAALETQMYKIEIF